MSHANFKMLIYPLMLRKFHCLFILPTVFFMCFFSPISWAQDDVAPKMSSVNEFEFWAKTEVAKYSTGDLTKLLSDATIKRISQGYYIKDSTILMIVNAHIGAENKEEKAQKKFELSKSFILKLIEVLEERDFLKAQLRYKMYSIYLLEGNNSEAEDEVFSSYKIASNVNIQTELSRLNYSISTADLRLLASKKQEAESLYLEVFFYRWSQLYRDPEAMHTAKLYYERAGWALVSLRQGNLSLLNQISFYPSTSSDLKKYLDDSIKSAYDKKQKDDEEMKASLERRLKQQKN